MLAFLLAPHCLAAAAPSSAYERIYFKSCAVCHGEKGDGRSRAQTGLDPPPRDFTSAGSAEELSRERMILGVTYGRPGTAMVAWENRLSEDEIAGVVDFIRGRFMGGQSAGAPAAQQVATGGAAAGGNAADADGERVYRRHCSTCHGDRGNGASWAEGSLTPPPRDFTSPAVRQALTLERMLASVTHGRPGTAMMAFGSRLSAEEIDAVVGYIRSEFMGLGSGGDGVGGSGAAGSARAPAHGARAALPAREEPADMSLPFEGGLVGDAGKGRAFYLENCHVCHGRDGDGKGSRAGFIQPPPRDFLSAESRRSLNRPALFSAISSGKRGTVMAAWKTVLSDQEIADVAEFVYQAYVRPTGEAGDASAGEAKKKAMK